MMAFFNIFLVFSVLFHQLGGSEGVWSVFDVAYCVVLHLLMVLSCGDDFRLTHIVLLHQLQSKSTLVRTIQVLAACWLHACAGIPRLTEMLARLLLPH